MFVEYGEALHTLRTFGVESFERTINIGTGWEFHSMLIKLPRTNISPPFGKTTYGMPEVLIDKVKDSLLQSPLKVPTLTLYLPEGRFSGTLKTRERPSLTMSGISNTVSVDTLITDGQEMMLHLTDSITDARLKKLNFFAKGPIYLS